MEAVKEVQAVTRTEHEIKEAYGQTCAEVGELNYKESLHQKELFHIQTQKHEKMVFLAQLNDEARALKKSQDETPAATETH